MKVISLFSGIGAFEKALTNIGIDYELVNFCEIDKFAPIAYCAIHNEPMSKNLGDITQVNIESLPYADLITHGSPCQDFSIAGKQAGADGGTRSSLMWNTVEIVKHCKPKYVIWENVKNVLSDKHRHNFDKYVSVMQDIGYNSYFKVLNAKDYGIPQNRERIFIVSIRKDLSQTFVFPKKQKLMLRLKDMLEDDVPAKYYLSQKMIESFIKHKERHEEKGNGFAFIPFEDTDVVAHCLDTKEGTRSTNNFIKIAGNLNHYGNTQMNQVYSTNGIALTICTVTGGGREPKILIPQATKKGYIEVEDGGVFDMSFPESKTRRGRVQDNGNICPTIQTQSEICRVEVAIGASRGRNKENPSDRRPGIETEQRLEINNDGVCNTLTSVQKDNLVVEGGVYLNCSERFKKGILKNLSRCLKANQHDAGVVYNEAIRRLTPLECYRLMGFSDEDFQKAKDAGISDSQLYHQAGNSIVVKLLERIFENLLINQTFGESPHEVGAQITLGGINEQQR